MIHGLEDVRNTLARITQDQDLLDILYEFERTMDATGVSAYANWYHGELLEGPVISKYWVTCKFMYPEKLMPDPDGGLRLKKIGCDVSFSKAMLNKPVKILSPADWENNTTKKAKMKQIPVWIVTIAMPTKFIDDNLSDLKIGFAGELSNEDIAQNYATEENDVDSDEFADEDTFQ